MVVLIVTKCFCAEVINYLLPKWEKKDLLKAAEMKLTVFNSTEKEFV